MWYPDFAEYVKKNEISKNIDKIYFSLGNKEKNSKIEILKTVEDKTKEIYYYLSNNINTIYEENEGQLSVKVSDLPTCEEFTPASGQYNGLWQTVIESAL